MVDPVNSRRWLFRALFVALALVVLFLKLLPVTHEVGSWPGPDLMLGLAVAWVMRRPDFLPAPLAAAVFLVTGLLLEQPPGLNAALVVIALEVIRNRFGMWRDLPFVAEWGVASVLIAGVIIGNWLLMAVLMVAQAPLPLYVIELVATVLVYPLVAGFSIYVLGITRPLPGLADGFGR